MINEKTKNLCRGRSSLNESIKSKLKCFHLNTTSKPYLRLNRIKVEELYKRPQIVLIHNFLSDTEVETFKELTIPRIVKLKVEIEEDNPVYNEGLIADGASFADNSTSSVVRNTNRRITYITGNPRVLTCKVLKDCQVPQF